MFLPQHFRNFLRKKQSNLIRFKSKAPHKSLLYILFHGKVISPNLRIDYQDDYVRQFNIITKIMRINTNVDYIYPYDSLIIRESQRTPICSITVDYGKVLDSNLHEILNQLSNCREKTFGNREKEVIDSIENLARRVHNKLRHKRTKRSNQLASYFQHILHNKPICLDEAIQKLLFYNALFWQMGHSHIGLGRLDIILSEYYENDIKSGRLTETEAKELLKKLILVLGKDTTSKSLSLIGDTGQYILLGGIDKKGNTIQTKLTTLFLDLMWELHIPDPKLILRVNQTTSDDVWRKAIKSIMTGSGSPLLMNEKPIIDNLIKFGYNKEDVWNVGTSACWEPLIIGKSFDQNNPFLSIVAISPLNDLLINNVEFETFNDLYNAYKELYNEEIKKRISDIDFDCSPLFSLFFDDCISRCKDFTQGGAVYAYHGAQVVSLPNTINALLNIKRLVYDEKLYTLEDLRNAMITNFEDQSDLQILLSNTGKKFGLVDDDVLSLTNDLMRYTGRVVASVTCNGQPVKVGFSSPNYICSSRNVQASLDGRRNGYPFAVHISPISSKIDISEVLDFASKLDYQGNQINGNVVDFILPTSYVNNIEKLIGILRDACSKGVFELQLNVLDKRTLLDAKSHPEKYPNLIVRVWGFSAYFNDLPDEFKNNLIQRAEIYGAA